MPKPLARKLSLQKRMQYPTIRHLSTEQAGLKIEERLIAGDKTTYPRLIKRKRYSEVERIRVSFLSTKGNIGTGATMDFVTRPSIDIWKSTIMQFDLPLRLGDKLIRGTTLDILRMTSLSEDIGLATKMLIQIERIARARKINNLRIYVGSNKIRYICYSLKWKEIVPDIFVKFLD